MVAHNIGEIKIQSLESWVKNYKGFAWGWENGNILVKKSRVDKHSAFVHRILVTNIFYNSHSK